MTSPLKVVAAIREALQGRLTPGPWRWWTSNSFRRLSSDATGKDGDVLYAFNNQADRHPDICISDADAALIQACNPEAITTVLDALDAALERVKVLEAGSWPEKLPTRIKVSYSPADWDTFIYGASGHLTMEALASIDAQLRDEDADSLFDRGPGDYLLSASYFKGQYGFEGRCEIAPGWELSVEDFKPLDAAIDAAMEGNNG